MEESYALVEGRGGDGRVLEDWDEDILVLISVRRTRAAHTTPSGEVSLICGKEWI